jgi:EmrB/QacA subfamily drug resistance transporter
VSNTLAPQVAPPVARANVSLGVIVAIACAAQLMVNLDTTIVNVALPAMRASLHMSVNAQQWVVDGYLITFGGFLLLAARAGDLLGRRRVMQAGLIVFTLASLVGGLATEGTVLVIARFIQGLGAAALAPSSLSLIISSHSHPGQRTRALAIWGAVASGAGALGILLGGVLTAELSWRWVFFVNLPIGVGLFLATAVYLLPAGRTGHRTRVDVPGALTVTLGVGVLVFGVSEATSKGWGSALVVGSLVASAVLLGSFMMIERRVAQPLVPLAIYRVHNLRIANLVMALLGILITATLFFLSLYLQQVLSYSALWAGLSMTPLSVVLVLGTFASRRLIAIIGPRLLIAIGAVTAAGGLAWLSRLTVEPAYLIHILGPTLVIGIGLSFLVLPVTIAATSQVEPQDAGVAGGLVNMGRQLGGAIGLAILVTVASSVSRQGGLHSVDAAIVHGYRVALVVAAAVSLVAAVLASRLHDPIRPRSGRA